MSASGSRDNETVVIDPTEDGAEVVNMVCDRVRAGLLRRIGLADVLIPAKLV